MCLEPFPEGGETVSVSDGGGEMIPPLGGQTGEDLGLGAYASHSIGFLLMTWRHLICLVELAGLWLSYCFTGSIVLGQQNQTHPAEIQLC